MREETITRSLGHVYTLRELLELAEREGFDLDTVEIRVDRYMGGDYEHGEPHVQVGKSWAGSKEEYLLLG